MTAVGYVRVSTEDQAKEGVSLDNQKAKIEAYCQLKDLELREVIEDAGIDVHPQAARRFAPHNQRMQ